MFAPPVGQMALPLGSWLPGLLTLVRVPLAAAFPFAIDEPFVAVAIVAAAGLSDVLDGWSARRLHRTTAAGAILDPVTDKVFIGAVVLTLLLTDRLSFRTVLLVGIRDILELPLAVAVAFEPRLLADRKGDVKANGFGKAVTVLQFAALAAALVAVRYVPLLALCSAVSGVVAAGTYWSRVFRSYRTVRRAPNPYGPFTAGDLAKKKPS